METRQQLAERAAAMTDPADQYKEIVSMNGVVTSMALRRMGIDQLVALHAYAQQQPKLPHSGANGVAFDVRRELRRRGEDPS